MSEIAKPLCVLLSKNTEWHWEHEHKAAFELLKKSLVNAPVLKFYDVTKKIVLQVDACKSGLGAVLLQEDRPIALASKALDDAQSQYAVIKKELLAICFGCIKFHDYVCGKEIHVQTDHKPLVVIMHKPIHTLTAHMQRERMRLQNYDLIVSYVKGTNLFFADTLSRAHLSEAKPVSLFDNELNVAEIEVSNSRLEGIRKATKQDPALRKLNVLIHEGWPENKQELCAERSKTVFHV